MSRRRGSATALKLSEVVAARDMSQLYADIGICQPIEPAFTSPLDHVFNLSPLSAGRGAGRPTGSVADRALNPMSSISRGSHDNQLQLPDALGLGVVTRMPRNDLKSQENHNKTHNAREAVSPCSRSTSRMGGSPNSLLYSRLKCEGSL